MNNPLVILDHVSLTRANRTILSDINLTIEKGEHWAILGPNGSGKTTLITLITAYLWPTEGAVTVLGDRYGTVDIREKRRHLGLVSSALFERVPASETLLDVILSGRYGSFGIFDNPASEDISRAHDIAAFLHCEQLTDTPYGFLSFGERQRAIIGRALMAEPQLLMLDEPFEGLDINARELLLNRLDSLTAIYKGLTLILITHRVEEIPPGITHALILKDGSVLASGPKGTVISSKNLSYAMDVDIEIISRNGRLFAVVR